MSINGLPTLLKPPRRAVVADGQLPGGPKHIKLDAGTSADRLNSQLWTGGAITTDQDVEKLEAAGITADIDNRKTHDDSSLIDSYSDLPHTPVSMKTHPLIDYLWNGVLDDGEPKPVSWFSDAWMFAKPVLDKGGVIYSHCAAGHNRGPSIAYFLLRAYWGMTPQAALDLIHTRRPETVGDIDYAPDADAAIVQLGLVGANHEEAEKLPVPAAVPDPLKETAMHYELLPSEMRLLRQLREDGGYNPDQPRAANGEWTGGGGGDTKYSPADMADAQKIVDSLHGATEEQARQMLQSGQALDSQKLHSQDGGKNYDQSSRDMHEAMVNHFMGNSTEQSQPRAIFTAGGPASGKAGLAGAADPTHPERNLEVPDDKVRIDPDDIKKSMGTYHALQAMGRSDIAAGAVHEESSDIAKALTAQAMDGQRNIVVDGVGDSKPGKFGDKIRSAIGNGYSTEVRYAYVPVSTAMAREESRYQRGQASGSGGRKVGEDVLRSGHAGVVNSYIQDVQHIPDAHVKVYSTEGNSPQLLAEKPAGETGIRVYDAAKYADHLAKAQG